MADHRQLTRTLASLRATVPMRPEWRDAVLHDIERLPQPVVQPVRREARRRWTFVPAVAIAAGLACAMVGGVVALGVDRARHRDNDAEPIVASSVAGNRAAVRFVFVDPTASTVALVGDFNGWSQAGTPMRRSTGGVWSIDLPLRAGRHTYAFVVDGMLVRDPNALDSADDDYGVPTSVVLVSEDKRT